MKKPHIKEFKIQNRADAIAFIDWLIASGLTAHFDDPWDLDSFNWGSTQLTKEEANRMERNRQALWAVLSPWTLFEGSEENERRWGRWIGQHESWTEGD